MCPTESLLILGLEKHDLLVPERRSKVKLHCQSPLIGALPLPVGEFVEGDDAAL